MEKRKKGKKKFPKVEVIQELRVRQHYSRIIAPRILAKILQTNLPRLHKFHHEKWHDIDGNSQLFFERSMLNIT
jgi:hypothetical protein